MSFYSFEKNSLSSFRKSYFAISHFEFRSYLYDIIEKYKEYSLFKNDAPELILKIVFANRLLLILENFKKVVTFQTSSFILMILLNSEKYKKISRTMLEN